MRLSDAQRLSRMVYEHDKALKHAVSLKRRLMGFLAHIAPEDDALRETTLAALEQVRADALAFLLRDGDDCNEEDGHAA